MNEQFISDNFCDSEISWLLRELRFDEYCFGQYPYMSAGLIDLPMRNSDKDNGYAAAPLYQQACVWLRTKNIEVAAVFTGKTGSGKRKYLSVVYVGANRRFIDPPAKANHFYDPLDALKAAIKHAITILKQQNT